MFGRRSRRLIAAENAARAAALEAGATGSSHPDSRVDEAGPHGAAPGATGSATVEPMASPAPVLELSEERVFAAVLDRLQDFVGENGSWTLTRRSDSDTEVFFHDMAALSLARAVTSTLVDAAGLGDSTDSARRDDLSDLDRVHATSVVPAVDGDSNEDAAEAAAEATANPDRAVSPAVRTIMELDTIAVWADPKSHDPAYIDERMLHPETARTADADRANGQRRA
ncbi:hypothetical protein [Leifsonia sp. ALI-44-B]|jgi:hypothetical protein|uniref:hypothetical protein n=1 Tax=Leifsonia sp. ALI-44-B TaxID=1933776 RepID=UPI00117B4492|nr:hypothetical protein [Leifsonia sp. ALI-44-B]